jgi:hypothetical protein
MDALASKQTSIANPYALETIGRWFHKFLETVEPSVTVRVPAFEEGSQPVCLEYLTYANLLFKILNKPPITTVNGTALFDLFRYVSAGKRSGDLSLRFTQRNNLHIRYGTDTLVSSTRFYPVFLTDQLTSGEHNQAIFDAFHLFSAIARNNVIQRPVLIDLQRDLTLLVTRGYKPASQRLLTIAAKTSEFKNDKELDEFLTSIRGSDITHTLIYKSPYNTSISSVFKSQFTRARQFEIVFGTRLQYFEIKTNEVVLRPFEIIQDAESDVQRLLDAVHVVNTGHPKDLFEKLAALKEAWAGIRNRFKTPFPAKWLMCINADQDVAWWIARYRKDFPAVQGSLRQQVEEIIRALHQLNWTILLKQENSAASIIVPTSNFYSEVVTSFRNYCQGLFQRVIEPTDVLRRAAIAEEIIVLDPFNITMLSNLAHLAQRNKFKIIAPDILYHVHHPYLKYHLARHQVDPALLGLRSVLDTNYKQSQSNWTIDRKRVLAIINNHSAAYFKSIGVAQKDSPLEPEDDDPDFVSDITLEHEITEQFNDKEARMMDHEVKQIFVVTTEGKEYDLLPTARVLFRKVGYLLDGFATVLEPGMQFIPLSEITTDLDRQTLVNKLASMPLQARSWKEQLKERTDSGTPVYNLLQKQGLTISHKRFFQNWHENDNDAAAGEFHLPRSYQDWAIVCQYLNIDEMERAWDCHRCRANQNAIKRAYAQVLQLLSDNQSFGVNTDEAVLERVQAIFQTETGMQDVVSTQDRLAHARSVVRSITSNLALHEIRTVKKLTYG